METNQNNTRKEKREALKKLSNSLKPLVVNGIFDSVNEAILSHYREGNPEITEFNTFAGWKKLGATVKKGVTAYVVWAQPRALKNGKEEQNQTREAQNEDEKENSFFPICYLFANTQVITAEEKEAQRLAQSEQPRAEYEVEEALPF